MRAVQLSIFFVCTMLVSTAGAVVTYVGDCGIRFIVSAEVIEVGFDVLCDDSDECTEDVCTGEDFDCVYNIVSCDDGVSCTLD